MSTIRSAILAAAAALEESREALCLLDAASGDGDHGVTMAIGARRVRAQLEQLGSDEPEALVRAAAIGMAGAGGTIGAVYGRGLLAIATMLHDGPPAAGGQPASDGAPVAVLAAAAERAATAVGALGAGPGDKTILDTILPVAAALTAAAAAGTDLPTALGEADRAARAGADATAGMVARVGRSARFAERGRGTLDPGAESLAIVVHALVGSTGREA